MAKRGMPLPGRIILIAGGLALLYGVFNYVNHRPKAVQASTQIGSVTLARDVDRHEASLAPDKKLPLPGSNPSANTGNKMTVEVMEWNAQFSLMYANGGPATTEGSLIEKAGLQVSITRQDDCNKTCADFTKFAQDYKKDPTAPGFIGIFMGDGMPAFNAGFYTELAKISTTSYNPYPITFFAVGKSYGEDKFMGPAQWKLTPRAALGGVVCCVPRDGDMNIPIQWCGGNGIPMNPDIATYDPDALNIMSASDFLDAPNKYITGFSESRHIVKDGKTTGRDTIVKADAIATWTPGDVNAATQKGGLVVIASTKQYSTQMPAVLFTVKQYAENHRVDIDKLIAALGAAGDQVRSFPEAKSFAAKVSAQVYNDKDGAYWLKYYNGVVQEDAKRIPIELGGSMAFNLADAANTFGLGTDRVDRYKAVYTTLGDIIKKMYPTIIPTYPEYDKVVDKTYIADVLQNNPLGNLPAAGKALQVTYADKITNQMSSKAYTGQTAIQFASGSAVIKPVSSKILNDIFNNAVLAENCKLAIYGYTDNVGNPTSNQVLSEKRANAVRDYLIRKGLSPQKIEASGFGEADPIADNSTSPGREQNRRVQIIFGQ
jgi:OmpA-OmpF porin, OOP family